MEINPTEIIASLLAGGGGGAVIAYAVFKAFGSKWLENRFQKNLSNLRHEHEKEIQKLQASIDKSLDVTIRVQEREFNSLSECWKLTNIAFGKATQLIQRRSTIPDFSRISNSAKNEFLEELEIPESQKQEVLSSTSPNEILLKVLRGSFAYQASVAQGNLRNFLFLNEIFIREDIFAKFGAILVKLVVASEKEKLFHDTHEPKFFEDMEAAMEEAKVIIEELAPELRSRFFNFAK